MKILVKVYEVEGFPHKPPVWIEEDGKDPERICPTGHGIVLGDALKRLRKAYGNPYAFVPREDGAKMLSVKWPTLQTISAYVHREDHIEKTTVFGEIEQSS